MGDQIFVLLRPALRSFEARFPLFLGAVFVALLGFLAAWLLRALLLKVFANLGRILPHAGLRRRFQVLTETPRLVSFLAQSCYWLVLFLFLMLASEMLGFSILSSWLKGAVALLPRVSAAVLTLCFGFITGVIVKDVAVSAAASAGFAYGQVLGRMLQVVLIFVTAVIAAQEIGVDITFVTTLVSVVMGGILLGASLAFGLGARTAVSNILAAYYLRKIYKVGQKVRIGDARGRIILITAHNVLLESAEGQICVPARLFSENVSTLVGEG